MIVPANLKYTANHQWAKPEADGSIVCGITHHAQESLGVMVYVGAPEIGRSVAEGEACGAIESVKAAYDLHAPLAGEVIAVNGELATTPEKINQDAYAAWIFRVRPSNPAGLESLLDADAYRKLVAEGG